MVHIVSLFILKYITMYVNHIKMFDLISKDIALVFLLFHASVYVLKFSICASKLSLLTGKIWTCGHKNMAFGLKLQGGL